MSSDKYTYTPITPASTSNKSTLLTEGEKQVMAHLADAWNAFIALGEYHRDDVDEFRHAIHTCQNIIMSRPVVRDAATTAVQDLMEGREKK